jgi:NADH-quinone oxidoreductase subunit C
MNREELKAELEPRVPGATWDEGGEWPVVNIGPAQWKDLAATLKGHAALAFDYLFCVTCVDWKTHLTMVYHLTSTVHRHTLVVKAQLDRERPEIATVCNTWKTAEFHEREQYEMFGVQFLGHPDLRRLILTDDFRGYPLRKDFEDPVNMIRL